MLNSNKTVRLSTKKDLFELQKMWKEVFLDSDDFIKLYFENIFSFENAIVVENKENKTIESQLHILQREIVINNKSTKVDYIFGVATIKEYRRQGNMRLMLEYAWKISKIRGNEFSILLPENGNIYIPFGYTFSHYLRKCSINIDQNSKLDELIKIKEVVNCNNISLVLEIYNEFITKYNAYIKRDIKIQSAITKDSLLSGDYIFLALYNNTPYAYIAVNKEKNEIYEIMFKDTKHIRGIINSIIKLLNIDSSKISITIADDDMIFNIIGGVEFERIPYIMIKAYNGKVFDSNDVIPYINEIF